MGATHLYVVEYDPIRLKGKASHWIPRVEYNGLCVKRRRLFGRKVLAVQKDLVGELSEPRIVHHIVSVPDGTVRSRILPHFNGEIVTNPRSQSYFIVTEFGAVNLTGRTTWERAEMLISIAHPDFRDELIRAAQEQIIWIRSNKR